MAAEKVLMEHPKTKAQASVSRRSFQNVWSNPDRVEVPWVEVKPKKEQTEDKEND